MHRIEKHLIITPFNGSFTTNQPTVVQNVEFFKRLSQNFILFGLKGEKSLKNVIFATILVSYCVIDDKNVLSQD